MKGYRGKFPQRKLKIVSKLSDISSTTKTKLNSKLNINTKINTKINLISIIYTIQIIIGSICFFYFSTIIPNLDLIFVTYVIIVSILYINKYEKLIIEKNNVF